MSELIVRPADKADLPDLLRLYDHLAPGDVRCPDDRAEDILERFLGYTGSAILVGHVLSAIVTSCTCVIIPNLTRGGSPYALIENVVTDPAYRNRGYGKAILRAAVGHAWGAGCYKVMLMTGSKRPATLAFYEAAGFEQSKTGYQIRRMQ